MSAAAEMIARLTGMWSDAAGEPVTVEIQGDRIVGFASELGVLRIASQWANLARNLYPQVVHAPHLNRHAFAMDHMLAPWELAA